MQYLFENKEWIFSGLGVLVITTLVGIVARKSKRRQDRLQKHRDLERDMYRKAFAEFDDEMRKINQIADGTYKPSHLSNNWFSVTPYEHIDQELKELLGYWSEFKVRRFFLCREAAKLRCLIKARFDQNLQQDMGRLQENAKEIQATMRKLRKKMKDEDAT